MTIRHTPYSEASPAQELQQLILDGTKIQYHTDRLEAWERRRVALAAGLPGEIFAPITIDMALTRKCDASCWFCYAQLQENDRHEITKEVIDAFLHDSARMGVRGISLVSDGESLLSPVYVHTIQRGANLGISMASGTNGRLFTRSKLREVLPSLTYLRINFSAGTRQRYSEIMGFRPDVYDRVCANIRDAVAIKGRLNLPVTIGMQMVYEPRDADQLLPFARLAVDLGVDYAVIKHCSDDEYGTLGVQYGRYKDTYPLLREAEALSTKQTQVVVKWQKIGKGNIRDYDKCFGPPFLLQISGSGLVAPCGQMFNDKYAKFHVGNICEERWWDIWQGERYWEVMDYLHSDNFDPRTMCGVLCLQDLTNRALFNHASAKVRIETATGSPPMHLNFL